MSMRVTQYGEPVLKQAGEPVSEFGTELADLAEAMIETMYAEDGIGLAAQQVDRPIRLCVIDVNFEDRPPDYPYELDGKTPPLDLIMPLALVNPEVQTEPGHDVDYEEGCLSFPDIRGMVKRPAYLTVEFQDLQGHPHTLTCGGILARVIQHEVDHLNGVLFIDRMTPQELKKIESRVKKLKRQTRDWLKARQGS